jgi:hypothetical protein
MAAHQGQPKYAFTSVNQEIGEKQLLHANFHAALLSIWSQTHVCQSFDPLE